MANSAIEATETYQYNTFGTCSKSIDIEITGTIVTRVHFNGGCPGALSTIATLIAGCTIDDVISKFSGVQCRKGTSCPDQLAKALIQIREKKTEGAVSPVIYRDGSPELPLPAQSL